MCGIPGASKTTLAKKLEKQLGAIRMCPGEWMDALEIYLHAEEKRERIEALQWRLSQDLLSLGLTIIIEWGMWAERDQLRVKARALGASVELRYITASPDEIFARIQRRGREDPPIEWTAIDQWYRFFQVPTAEEWVLFDEATVVSYV